MTCDTGRGDSWFLVSQGVIIGKRTGTEVLGDATAQGSVKTFQRVKSRKSPDQKGGKDGRSLLREQGNVFWFRHLWKIQRMPAA